MDNDMALQSIKLFPKQIKHAIEDIDKLTFDESYKNADKIVIGGMGGSMFSYYVITALYLDLLKVPFISVNDYRLPSYVNQNTLFIASSYSGTT